MIDGKNIMSWNVPAIYNGDPEQFAELIVQANFQAVCLKAGDGGYVQHVSKYSPWPTWGENIRPELMVALRARGIKVYFWHFVYGYSPTNELLIAQKQCSKFQPDGYIWNAEGSFDRKPKAVENARLITEGLKISHPYISQALCWWALPESPITGAEWHPKEVAHAFFEIVDVGMPMMYWQGIGANAALSYFEKSLKIWRNMTDLPIVPIGRSYNGDGGYADASGITAFANRAYEVRTEQNIIGNSWYSLDKAVQYLSWLDALQDTPKYVVVVPDPDPDPDPNPTLCPNDALVKKNEQNILALTVRVEDIEDKVFGGVEPPIEEWPYTATIDLDDHDKDYTIAWAITTWNGDVPIIETNVWAETNDERYRFVDKEVINVYEVKVTSDGGQKWFELAGIPADCPHERLFVKKEQAMKNW